MRYAILTSITISQIGFVATYTIFVAENLQAFILAVTKCIHLIGLQYFILIQMIIFLPLSLIRNLAKLSTTALVADVFILAGLIYIFGSEMSIIGKKGVADVKMFNPNDFPLFIGSVALTVLEVYGALSDFIYIGRPYSRSKASVWSSPSPTRCANHGNSQRCSPE